jgi:mannan endo-1,4-beta-mannosidase
VTRPARMLLIAGLTIFLAALCTFEVFRPPPVPRHPRAEGGASCGQLGHPSHYLGLITQSHPGGAELQAFAKRTGIHPNIVAYFVPFRASWDPAPACRIIHDGALPLIQINPPHVSLAAIADGVYAKHLSAYARQVRKFGRPIAIGFGHEMNGSWYRWGYRHVPAKVFVAAWRQIVTVFRQQHANNVTWVWTVNIIDPRKGIPNPAAWWPGGRYVNWVGIDGYYYKKAWTFASLFGPTIRAIHSLTLEPIIISETAAAPDADQAAKIANLFAGVREYGLLGFVWFDAPGFKNWRLSSPAAFAAYSQGAKAFAGQAP